MIEWRRDAAATVVSRPTRLDRARSLGYKAKKGYVVVRLRLLRGGRKRERAGVKGRKSRKQYSRKILKMGYRWVAEIRAARAFPNLEVLNSYLLAKDGKYAFYEIIMVDPNRPEIVNDSVIKWIASRKNRRRAERGLTSAARKSRGLRSRSRTLKVRPSGRANMRRGK
jgi:large subunit ribosomal protein L15e